MFREMLKNMDRKNKIIIFFSIFFSILLIKLAYLTIVKGDYYREVSENNRLKEIPIPSKRGEIFDRNGVLLATNKPSFNVRFVNSNLDRDELNTVALKTMKILEKANEKHVLFPIQRGKNGKFYYTFDKEKSQWLRANGFSNDATPREVIDSYRRSESISGKLTDAEAYNIIMLKGTILPISTSKNLFWYDTRKSDFLKLYRIDSVISADKAFRKIKEMPKLKLDKYSDTDAIRIMAFVNQIIENAYMKYKPLVISENVSKKTASMISEMKIELPGIEISISPIRSYPNNSLASHSIGYMGKISSDAEKQKYVKDNGYNENQLIGKTGIEGKYELELKGKDGKKFIQVDVLGRIVDMQSDKKLVETPPKAGKDITLSIDKKLQENLEKYLKKTIYGISVGGTYTSKWGNFSFYEAFGNAGSGAAVVVEVETGKILAKASYPDFNLNDFSAGISAKDWKKLEPRNPRDPLSPRPLYDTAAFTAIQPGSTFKMVTAFAALKKGLSPYTQVYDAGFIDLGGTKFGCWIYNMYKGRHGYVNMFKGLEVSCNVYFYSISSGYDYCSNRSLGYSLSTDELLDTAKSFGLGQPTGIEIPETSGGLPDAAKKKESIAYLLRSKLVQYSADYFIPSIANNKNKLDKTIDDILSWADENPSRPELINRLNGLGVVNKNYSADSLADIIKFDYFNLMSWNEGDKFNLAIGQGDHKYTVLQMAKFVSAIANGGYVNDLSIVEKIGNKRVKNNIGRNSINVGNNFTYLKQGMLLSASGDEGTSSNVFTNFPVKVAAKTGTAQNQATIPPKDEKAYLKRHLSGINSKLTWEKVTKKAKKILKDRSKEISSIQDKINAIQDETEEKTELTNQLNSLLASDYLKEENALRTAIIELSNYRVTGTDINRFRSKYSEYAWFVSFAPYDKPKIAVVAMIPQGGHGGYCGPLAREIYADYFGLNKEFKKGGPKKSSAGGINTN